MLHLAPSILSADFTRLGEQIKEIEKTGTDYLHIDVMDGIFVPSISFGMPVISSIRKASSLTFDVHLMIEDPDRYIDDFKKSGADILTVHAEACRHIDRTMSHIHEAGMKCGVAVNPGTSLSAVEYALSQADMILIMSVNPGFGGQKFIDYSYDKIAALKEMIKRTGRQIDIEVDGGVTPSNAGRLIETGANVLVAGSAVFRGSITDNIRAFEEVFENGDFRTQAR